MSKEVCKPKDEKARKAELKQHQAWMKEAGVTQEMIDAFDSLLKIVGGGHSHLVGHVLEQAAYSLGDKEDYTPSFRIVAESIQEQKPKDATEAAMIAKATALYSNGMEYLRRSRNTDRMDFVGTYSNLATKLLRLHNETIDALGRYRRGGSQKITVVHMAEKMVVTNNITEGGGGQKNEAKAHA